MSQRRVFQPALFQEWYRNAHVGGPWQDDWIYAFGYKSAGDVLSEHAVASRATDLFFYPTCFLYRHAIEIILKELIRETESLIRLYVKCGSLDEQFQKDVNQINPGLEKCHSIERLLKQFEERIKLIDDRVLPGNIRATLIEIHNIDPSGQRFRYARVRGQDNKSSFPDYQHYDIKRIGKLLGETIDFLINSVGGWLDAQIDNANEHLKCLNDCVDENSS